MKTPMKGLVHNAMTSSINGKISAALWMGIFATTLGAPLATAAPITWTLVNAQFREGGMASGSFVFDASKGVYSSINIVTTPTQGFAGETYTSLVTGNASFASTASLLFVGTNTAPGFAYFLDFLTPLTNAGGTVPLALFSDPSPHFGSQEFRCADAACNTTTLPTRYNSSGSVTSTPEPSAWGMFALGAFAIFAASRTRRIARFYR